MSKRIALFAVLAAVTALAAAAFAFGGGSGLINDDGHLVRPGTLDDGKQYLAETSITTAQAVAAAERAWSGQLGQVDLESNGGRIVYIVDVGNREVGVDATDGSVVSIAPRD
jgi:uncharacterized membrane protein YkoI